MRINNQIIDISLPLDNNTPVYPGNPNVRIEHFKSASGQLFNSQILLGTHVGTHIDAPAHAFPDGRKIQDFPLNYFIGPVRVLDLSDSEISISKEALAVRKIKKGERILVKTSNSERGFSSFYDDYVFLSPGAANYLASNEILIFGIDAFSVKQKGSTDNRPHTELLSRNIPIIEGLNLASVEEGEYFLSAAPLPAVTNDAAPTRAFLFEL